VIVPRGRVVKQEPIFGRLTRSVANKSAVDSPLLRLYVVAIATPRF
jgi:hypothetical protein